MFSRFDFRIDFGKSQGSYFFEEGSQQRYLDFYSQYSSLPLGYNHPIFGDEFFGEIKEVAAIRFANNLFKNRHRDGFEALFKPLVFSEFIHYNCTGALAVESALKAALHHYRGKRTRIVSLDKAFHGINSWGFLTDLYLGCADRLEYYPRLPEWSNLPVEELIREIETGELAAVIIEPIRSTSGDLFVEKKDLERIRAKCTETGTCLIFDEIQTGFGTTGYTWYWERVGVKPDILVFGKKAQICGIVAIEKFSEAITSPVRKLQVTFDGDLIDMVRAKYVLRAFKEHDLLKRVRTNEKTFTEILSAKTKNFRIAGHLMAFDFETTRDRDDFIKRCLEKRFLCNTGGDVSIRMRPNLAVSDEEIAHFRSLMSELL